MINLYKANMQRIFKNILFIGGLIIAFIATYAFTANILHMTGRFEKMGCDGRMFFISIAMMGFFTIFVPVFTHIEYSDGVIRNKIIAGYSQKEVYFSHMLSHFSALGIMIVCHMIAGFIGGVNISGQLLLRYLILFLALCGYISVLLILAMRIKRMVLLAVLTFLVLQICYTGIMIGNALLAFVFKGTQRYIASLIYNIVAFGQWLSRTCIADDYTNPGTLAQILISLAVILISALIGTLGLGKRDLQ
ncbi:hypothetical protein [Butyrivibrio sp. WCE2006]|uniref:hypothetical protein n=1 Tax=Butyrivibrio sp. WCE2006 TaxID=1410611 RepID=UPI0005D1B477|nr:hypothetical protein [Butyrivibrio sp. WCE2006]